MYLTLLTCLGILVNFFIEQSAKLNSIISPRFYKNKILPIDFRGRILYIAIS